MKIRNERKPTDVFCKFELNLEVKLGFFFFFSCYISNYTVYSRMFYHTYLRYERFVNNILNSEKVKINNASSNIGIADIHKLYPQFPKKTQKRVVTTYREIN